jgi:hypothetical protein
LTERQKWQRQACASAGASSNDYPLIADNHFSFFHLPMTAMTMTLMTTGLFVRL